MKQRALISGDFIAAVPRLHNPNSKLRFNLIIQYPLPIQSKERANL